jgi:hypothetical protein
MDSLRAVPLPPLWVPPLELGVGPLSVLAKIVIDPPPLPPPGPFGALIPPSTPFETTEPAPEKVPFTKIIIVPPVPDPPDLPSP